MNTLTAPQELPVAAEQHQPTPEEVALHGRIGVASATFYPNWYPTPEGEEPQYATPEELAIMDSDGVRRAVDKLRGDLALETATEAIQRGYKMVVVDGGSSSEFQEALQATGVAVEEEKERGMSAGRRQAMLAVSKLEGVDVLAWTEPEKVSMITDKCLDEPARTVLRGEADLVVPHRSAEAFATYPDYQAKYEIESDELWNDMFRRYGVLPDDAPDLDGWIGPRVIPNRADMRELFTRKYEFSVDNETFLDMPKTSTELWSNFLFIPVAGALATGKVVKSVDVDYHHPAEQTKQEIALQDRPGANFEEKRKFQQATILYATLEALRMFAGKRSALRRTTNKAA